MKQCILILMTVVFCSTSISSQEPLLLKKPICKSKVVLHSDTTIIQAAIFELKDSSILLSNSTTKEDYKMGNYSIQELNIPQIITIQAKKRIGWLHGMIIGAGTGLLIGGIWALAAEDDPPCPNVNPIETFVCVLVGKKRKQRQLLGWFHVLESESEPVR